MDKRRKEILVLAGGLVVLLVALYCTFRPSAPAAQATPRTAAPAAMVATAKTTAAPEAQAAVTPTADPVSDTTAGRNPFRPVIATARVAAPITSPPPVTRLARLTTPPLMPLRPVAITPFSGNGLGGEVSRTPVITPTNRPAEEPLALTGIVYGDPSIAIIRKGSQRYFVRPGDTVEGRYTVQSVAQRRVILVSSHGALSLDLTGRM